MSIRRQRALALWLGAALFATGCTSTGSPMSSPRPGATRHVAATSPASTRTSAGRESPRPTGAVAITAPSLPPATPVAAPSDAPLPPKPTAADMIRAHGIVRSVDKAKLVIVIEHDAIEAANLPKTTTRFAAKSYEVVTDVGEGDEVDFDLTRDGSGNLVVVDAVPMAR